VRQWLISVPKRLRGMFADRPNAVAAVTALAIGNVGKLLEAGTSGHGGDGHATGGCCEANQKPRSHDTSRIAWAKLMARVGEEFPLQCPGCGGDIRLIAFRLLYECKTIPGLRTLRNLRLLRTPCPRAGATPQDSDTPRRTARAATALTYARPPTEWAELMQAHDDRDFFQATDRRAARDRHSQPLTGAGREASTKPLGGRTRSTLRRRQKKRHSSGKAGVSGTAFVTGETGARGSQAAVEMFDDALMVGIMTATLSRRRLQQSEGRWLKLVSGAVILLLGLVMLFRPDLLE